MSIVAERAHEVVYRDGSFRLVRFATSTSTSTRIPVVLVYSFINRPTILDLLPERSVVRSMVDAGHDVFLADWGEPGLYESRLGLGRHVLRLARAVQVAAALAGTEQAHLLGYCLGGTAALCLAALEPALVRSVALLATPVVFRDAGLLAAWATAASVDPARFRVGRHGNVPGALLRELLRYQDPIGQAKKWLTLAERRADDGFATPFLAQERWANDAVDLPGALFADLIEGLYREDRLAAGKLEAGGRPIRLDAIRAPVLNVVADGDRIVPEGSSLPLAGLVGPQARVETLRVDGGHIGMTVGRRAPATTHRAIAEFFRRCA